MKQLFLLKMNKEKIGRQYYVYGFQESFIFIYIKLFRLEFFVQKDYKQDVINIVDVVFVFRIYIFNLYEKILLVYFKFLYLVSYLENSLIVVWIWKSSCFQQIVLRLDLRV